MRSGFLALGVAGCIGLSSGWLACSYRDATGAALSEDARLAMELRCEGREARAAADCRRLLAKLYLAGTLDPEKTLRAHCTPASTRRWGRRPPPPPALCVQRYGGWWKGADASSDQVRDGAAVLATARR